MKRRLVVVGMSGGVDSSVAAALLKKQGYEVIGVTMDFSLSSVSAERRSVCCGLQAIEDAKKVALKLGIRHYVLNFSKALEEYVIKNFIDDYLKARTPNPCIRCNFYIKFGLLLKKALSWGADFLATGHYARIQKVKNKFFLKKAKDLNKDQSYFLYLLNQSQLKRILFPLGGYTKQQVIAMAKEWDLEIADKPSSQEICFINQGDYRKFLKERLKGKIKAGLIVDEQGNILGRHQGLCFYTIGQRQGLGVAKGYPLYIVKMDVKNNLIVVGKKENTYSRYFFIKKPHFILEPIKNKIVVDVKIRYNHQQVPAEIYPFRRGIKVMFKRPQSAVTPGQSAVFYKDDLVIGGGIIETEWS